MNEVPLPRNIDSNRLFPNNKNTPDTQTRRFVIEDAHLATVLDGVIAAADQDVPPVRGGHPEATGGPDPDAWWLREVHALRGRMDELVKTYFVSLLKLNGITTENLNEITTGSPFQLLARHHAELTFTYILSKLEEIPISHELSRLPETIGQSWADRGFPIDRLLPRFNMHFRVMWDSLIEHADRDRLPMLALRAEQIWTVVNDLSVEIQKAYSQITARAAHRKEDLHQAYLKRLMEEPPTPRDQLEQISEELEVPIDHSYMVFGASVSHREVLRTSIRSILPAESTDLILEEGDIVVAFVPASDWVIDALTKALTGVAWVLAPVASDLTEIASRARLLRILLPRMDDAPGLRRLTDMWDILYSAETATWSDMLVTEVLGDLAYRDDPEAERILETVSMFVQSGSTTATSSALYCHRNTVLNRLRAFRDISGHDITVPREAASVVMALAAMEQKGEWPIR